MKAKGSSVHPSSAKANLEDLTSPVKASPVKAKAKASNTEFGQSQFQFKSAQSRNDFVRSLLARELAPMSPRQCIVTVEAGNAFYAVEIVGIPR